ncbi:hypothetical protein PINS_up022495 [Pythium insidiosum]|nr:hypothetical protein PINS_up022495 [Pythium insidiosum]
MRGDIHDAIREGMRNRKAKAKGVAVATAPPVVLPDPVGHEVSESSQASDWLASIDANSVGIMFRHGLCELRGLGNFGTATSAAAGCALAKGKWQYEVKLITDGVIQLGWAETAFVASSETGDGVGDHAQSWAYDGCRQLKWTGGDEQEYGMAWERGDIISCLLDLDDGGTIRFARNGELMDVAFSGVSTKASRGFFPAISVEQGEILLVNVGAQPLLYPVEGFKPVVEGMRPMATTETKTDDVVVEKPKPAEKKPEPVATEAKKTVEKEPKPAAPKQEFPPLDLDKFKTSAELEALGLDALKAELQRRKLKCGGTLEQRAQRLLTVRGKSWDEIDPKLKDRSHN